MKSPKIFSKTLGSIKPFPDATIFAVTSSVKPKLMASSRLISSHRPVKATADIAPSRMIEGRFNFDAWSISAQTMPFDIVSSHVLQGS